MARRTIITGASVSLAKVLNCYYEVIACLAQKDQIGDIKNLNVIYIPYIKQ